MSGKVLVGVLPGDPQVAADVEAYVGDLIASQLVERLDRGSFAPGAAPAGLVRSKGNRERSR